MEVTINQLSAFSAILVFTLYLIYRLVKRRKRDLYDLTTILMAAGMLPIACCFALYSVCPELIESFDSLSLQITMIGLILIYVCTKIIMEKFAAPDLSDTKTKSGIRKTKMISKSSNGIVAKSNVPE